MNPRKAIRKEVAALLKTLQKNGAVLFDPDSVYSHRVTGLDDDHLPAAVVFIDGGEAEHEHDGDLHTVDLIIQLYDKDPLNIDDKLDDLDEQVNPLINSNPTLNGLVDSIELASYDFNEDEQQALGMLELKYTVKFIY